MGDFKLIVCNSVKVLSALWDREMAWAIDTSAPQHPLPPDRAKQSSWFTGELKAMKQEEQ